MLSPLLFDKGIFQIVWTCCIEGKCYRWLRLVFWRTRNNKDCIFILLLVSFFLVHGWNHKVDTSWFEWLKNPILYGCSVLFPDLG
ncbi:hypothetical protein Hanom_Chr07g00604411 [Helianthus anomalus]